MPTTGIELTTAAEVAPTLIDDAESVDTRLIELAGHISGLRRELEQTKEALDRSRAGRYFYQPALQPGLLLLLVYRGSRGLGLPDGDEYDRVLPPVLQHPIPVGDEQLPREPDPRPRAADRVPSH